jgi:protein transport protein SEC20
MAFSHKLGRTAFLNITDRATHRSDNLLRNASTMSFEGLQERLKALQETTAQLRELIGRLATLEFEPGSVPLGTEDESSPSGELSTEISQVLRSGLEEQELLQEEAKYLRPEGQEKTRLQDGVERVGTELVR